jgi:RNA recognition motif-containing protein
MGTRLYIGNLPYSADEAQIREYFESGGQRKVSQIKIITDRETGRPRGFAFVELVDAKMAESAIADLHGSQFGGRTIVVNQAHQPRQGGSGGDRSGGERAPERTPEVAVRPERTVSRGNDRGDRSDRGYGGSTDHDSFGNDRGDRGYGRGRRG